MISISKTILRYINSPYISVTAFLALGIAVTFGREVYLAYKLGMGRDLEIFKLALMIPHMLSQNFAPGFVAVAMPYLVRKENTQGHIGALSSVVQFNIITSLVITLVGCGVSPFLSKVLSPGFPKADQDALAYCTVICFAYFFLISLSFSLRSHFLLNEIYWPSSLASAVISSTFILSFSGFTLMSISLEREYLLSISVLIGGFVVLIIHIIAFRPKFLQLIRRTWSRPDPKTWKTLGAMISGAVIFKIINFTPRGIDRVVASMLEEGTVACIEYAFSILNVPGLVLGTSVATIVSPKLAKVHVGISRNELINQIKMPVLAMFVLAMLVSSITFFFSEEIVALALKRGAFNHEATIFTSNILRWQILSLPFIITSIVFAQALLSMNKLRILIMAVCAKLATKVLLVVLIIDNFNLRDFGITLLAAEIVFIAVIGGGVYYSMFEQTGPKR